MSRHKLLLAVGLIVALGPIWAAASPAPVRLTIQKVSDGTLEDRIQYRLEVSPVVKKYDVKVKVDLGIAMLKGKVATSAQKAEAERLAKIDGINRVESNITVDKAEDQTLADRVKAGLTKTGDALTDTWITTKVKWFLLGDDLLKDSNISVETTKNVVTLKGTVKTSAGRARAKALAMQTEGVHRVIDEMTIRP